MLRSILVATALVTMTSAFSPALAQTPNASLPQLAAGQSLGVALGISAVPNLRDVGGYKTLDGATVARGLVYRSDTFNPMSAEDIKKLALLGLKNDYDLRTLSEVKTKPDQMPPGVHYHTLNVVADIESSAPAELDTLLRDPKKANVTLGGGKIEALFKKGYREFISLPSARKSYRTLYLSLSNEQMAPGVFHCTTGKDRTGWATAALLTLLGVPKETVMADYMRTNENTIPHFQREINDFVANGGDRAIAIAIYGVKPEYLEAAFEEMQKQYGTIEKYFANGLGIDAAGQKTLRDLFLKRS